MKKFLLGPIGCSGPKNGASSELWICSKDFISIFHNKTGQDLHENYDDDFSERTF